ncbi:hypothetical protein [Leifsonia poae]|uniref:hypothetical protein n=1 Tax=Leifsonia poae TaxID=110933 RepID=UPI001CBF7B16|nr:hypothetical protein [Leifsonia poae]
MLSSLSNSATVRRAYGKVLASGFVPRRAFAHYFMNTEGIRSRAHLQNFYSTFFPESLTDATAHVWLYGQDGILIAKKDFTVPPFGQLYLEVEDIVGHDLDTEGMIFIDLEPPAAIRKQLKSIPNLQGLTVQTPFWMSYRDEHDNYMYVHSIESYRGKVFGAVWPLRQMMSTVAPERHPWQSWRLLDTALLDELQIVVMNHSHTSGTATVGVIGDGGERIWAEEVALDSRQTRRVVVPSAMIEKWKSEGAPVNVRVAIDPLFTGNGKPYVIMRYGGGPWSLHHG